MWRMTPDTGPVIPDKAFFRIGEVAEIVGVKPYVIRYWETEFKQLHPNKSRTNQRVYSRADVQLLITIKTLLYADGFTIEGARKQLSKSVRPKTGALPFPDGDDGLDDGAPVLESNQVKSFLSELDESKSELSRLRRRVDDAEARAHELDTKLTEERRARTQLTAWVRKEMTEAMTLVDATIDAEPGAKISSS
ncbi:MAG: MerR family transcriptional regulator [Pseudomonadota bacterium]